MQTNLPISALRTNSAAPKGGKAGFLAELRMNRHLYLLALPGIAFFLLFSYLPMFGILIAFKSYTIGQSIFEAPWAGLGNFTFFFTSGHAWRVTRNTLLLNALFIGVGTAAEIGFAILLNEIRLRSFKRAAQSVLLLPNFMSWIVISVIIQGFFASDAGMVNHVLKSLGLPAVSWFGTPAVWPPILVFFRVWKGAGFGSIVYLATIAGIDPQVYEAATIDGATRRQQIRYVTVPLLIPTAVMLLILSVGKIFYGDAGMIYGIIGDNAMLYSTTDVIDTYVLRALRSLGDLGMASAVGLWQSVMGLIFVLGSNALAKRYQNEAALF